MTVNKNTLDNVIHGTSTAAEKLAALENIDAVIQNAAFVRSGKPTKSESASRQQTIRHDFFEAPMTIGADKYIVKLDIAVINQSLGGQLITFEVYITIHNHAERTVNGQNFDAVSTLL